MTKLLTSTKIILTVKMSMTLDFYGLLATLASCAKLKLKLQLKADP